MDCIWPLGALLGEGPVWVAREKALWFTDIKGRQLHRIDPATGKKMSLDTSAQAGFVLPSADGKFIVGMQDGLFRLDAETNAFSLLCPIEADAPSNRLNDAVVDPTGHLWFGSMDNGETASTGFFYRLDDDGVARPRGFGCEITNGPAFSPDGHIGYFVDTLARKIWAYDVDSEGQLSGRRLFVEIEDGAGFPDGPSVDVDGHVWIGLYAGWAARRYAPDGKLVDTVKFPVANVTKLAFGGTDMQNAFATTAAKQLDTAALKAQPLAGGLFSFRVQVPGLAGFEIKHGI